MLEMVSRSGNFLPSQRQRSCTQMLKTLPIKRFYDQLKALHGDDSLFIQFVGLRFDEPQRTGIEWTENHIVSAYPLQALRITKADVNTICQRIQGIPLYYQEKSRSGCQICIFSRRSEVIDSWRVAPELMNRAAKMEQIPENVVSIYNHLPQPVSQLTGIGRNWMNYYRPSRLNNPDVPYEVERGRNKLVSGMDDLFGASQAKRLYVAVEYQFESNLFGMMREPFVFFEKIITYSTSLAGLKKALKFFWLHRIHTKEMHLLDEDGLRDERQIQILEIEVDDFDNEIPPKPEGTGVYTWQNDGKPLYAIRKTMAVIERILLHEGFYQGLKSTDVQTRKRATQALEKLSREKEYGRILSSLRYDQPAYSELVDDIDIADAPVPCAACSR